MTSNPRARGIPRPAPERGGEDPSARRAIQREGGPDRIGEGLRRDRRGRDTVRTAEGSFLRVDERGLNGAVSDAFEVQGGFLRLRQQARYRPNRTSDVSGSGADAAINARFEELEARIDVLVRVLRAQGGLG